jgi:hypothetical protein
MYLFIIIGVGISSFGLGRISINNNAGSSKGEYPTQLQNILEVNNLDKIKASTIQTNTKGKKYVASKNGKLYYSLGCTGATRIKEGNQIWFKSKEDAEKSGYTLSSNCK